MAVTAGIPEAVGKAVWIDVRNGKLDDGLAVEILRSGSVALDGLIGNATFGAAVGVDIARRDNLLVSVFGGVAHDWATNLKQGWDPVVGLRIKF